MKKKVIVFLTFIMLIALVACGTDGAKDVVNNEVEDNDSNINNDVNDDEENESDTDAGNEDESEGDNAGETEDENSGESEDEATGDDPDEETENGDSSSSSYDYGFENIYWGEGPDSDMDGVPDGAIYRIRYFDGEKCTISTEDDTFVYDYVVKPISESSFTVEFYEDGSLSYEMDFFMLDGMLCYTFVDGDFGGYIQHVIVDNQNDFE